MTTYPLSEPATIYATDEDGDATTEVLGKGTLSECADIVAGLPADDRTLASIRMDNLELSYGPAEVGALVQFLEDEEEGLSNKDIADIADKTD